MDLICDIRTAAISFLPSLCLLVVLYLLSVRYFRVTYSVFSRLNIPGPKPIPLFGNSLEFKSKFILDVFKDWYDRYGQVYGYYEGLRPSVVVSKPEMIKQILGKHFYKFHDRTECVPFLYWPDNINMVNARGNQWKRERSVTAPVFNSTSLREMFPGVVTVADRLVDILRARQDKNAPIDIVDWSDRYAVDSFALAAFGFRVTSLDDSSDRLLKFMKAHFQQGDIDNHITGLARLFPSLVPFLKLFNRDYEKIHGDHLNNVRHLIQKSKRDYQNGKLREKNLMASLLDAQHVSQDEENNDVKRGLTDDEIISQVHGLLGAGFGQTNNLLSFAIYNLAKYPDVQEKVCEEMKHLNLKKAELAYDDLSGTEYLDKVLYETLRVFPIAPGVTRVCTQSCEIDGVRFEEGLTLRLMSSPIYSDPEIYPQPDHFNPYRFTAEEKDKRHPQSFLGFGYGPRMCVGWRLGMLQVKAAIVRLLRDYTISLQHDKPLETTLRPVLCPKNGVWVILKNR